MAEIELVQLADPEFTDVAEMHVAGLEESYTRERMGDIPKQWERFNAELDRSALPSRVESFALVYPESPMRYLTVVEVAPGTALPPGWSGTTIPTHRYAKFASTGGTAMIPRVWVSIWTDWMPKSGMKLAKGQPMIEWYPEDWIRSGNFEIWIPVQ